MVFANLNIMQGEESFCARFSQIFEFCPTLGEKGSTSPDYRGKNSRFA
jgi:hypothetical protein